MNAAQTVNRIRFNFNLALSLALKSMIYHRMVALATIIGIATGMCVVSTILIVDQNTARTTIEREPLAEKRGLKPAAKSNKSKHSFNLPITKIQIIKDQQLIHQQKTVLDSPVPTQKLSQPLTEATRPTAKGEEDYQTMRLAIRMASLLAFFIGAITVFYTMRFSVESRSREFALLMCLGEDKKNVALSLLLETAILGIVGTFLGLLAAFPASFILLKMGISTTGRVRISGFTIPEIELSIITTVSISIALLGVIAPVRDLYRFQISRILQPRFVADDISHSAFKLGGLSWLISPMLLASYLLIRPFLESWLTVVYFFLFEAIFVIILTLVTLWWTRPFLRFSVRLIEILTKPMMPLESLLTVRRMRLNSEKFVFSIIGIVLVFSLLTSLHAITRTLKDEIYTWSSVAITPYFYYKRNNRAALDEAKLEQTLEQNEIYLFRYSNKSKGAVPFRIIDLNDINRYRKSTGKAPFARQQVIFSRTLAARFGAVVGDYLLLATEEKPYYFEIVEISDELGTLAEDGQYIDIKSYALFAPGSPLFINNLDLSLGQYAAVRSANKSRPNLRHRYRNQFLQPYYRYTKAGRNLQDWQRQEIDKDFLIFDFILIMTVFLACIGIINTLLIQVHSRGRELSVLKTMGIDRLQMIRLLLVEGLVVGFVGAILAAVLGTILGHVTVSFLDHFTLFHYQYVWSIKATLGISLLAILSCCLSAIYPAVVATRISTAESLHYE